MTIRKPTAPYRLELVILDRLPPSPNALGGNRWKIQESRVLWRQLTRRAIKVRGAPPAPLKRARVTCTRFAPRPLDRDNLATSFKPVLDGLVQGKVLVDDSPRVIAEQLWLNGEAPESEIRIVVVVEEIP